MALQSSSIPADGNGAKSDRIYSYPRLTSPMLIMVAWLSVSSFSASLVLLPLISAWVLLRATLQVLCLASWHNFWIYAAIAVVLLALWPCKKWPWMSRQWQKLFALWNQLFHTTVVLPQGDSPKGPFILTVHPHGIIPITGCMIWEANRRLGFAEPDYFGGASAALRIPLVRQFLLHNGGVPAGRRDCRRVLKTGASYSVFSGGVTEMVLSKNSAEVLYLKKRRGVFELAQELGNVPVVPLLAFGTTKHFGRWPDDNNHWLTRLSRRLKASFLLPMGWLGLPIPNWHPVKLVLGPAIETSGNIEVAHQTWIDWFESSYAEHKESAGYGDRPLELL